MDRQAPLQARLRGQQPERPLWQRLLPLLIGLLLGIGLGLYVGWVAWPTQFTDAEPDVLEPQFKRDYTLMIAATYVEDGDLAGARRRLATLREEDVDGWLLALTNNHILDSRDPVEIRHLVRLATDLGLDSPLMAPYQEEPDGE